MTSPTADGQGWRPFTGDYEKEFYEVKEPGYALVVKHFWPNAGKLMATDGSGLVVTPQDNVEFRRCTCGHKSGGCLPSPPASGEGAP